MGVGGGVGYRFRWEWVEVLGIDFDGSGWRCWELIWMGMCGGFWVKI